MGSKGAGDRMAIPLKDFQKELFDSYQRAAAVEQQRAQLYSLAGYYGQAQTFNQPPANQTVVIKPSFEIDYASDSVVIMGKRFSRAELEKLAGPGTVGAQIAEMLRRGEK